MFWQERGEAVLAAADIQAVQHSVNGNQSFDVPMVAK